MPTRVTDALRELLTERGRDADLFAAEFNNWKSLGDAGAHLTHLFGKDGGYRLPQVNGKPYVLRHVHLVPLLDPQKLSRWNFAWRNKSRKVSNRVLVYVSDPRHGHLLLWILDEPDAHNIADMLTPDDAQLMHHFAVVADHFIQTGEIAA